MATPILANDLEIFYRAGPFATLAVASAAIFVLAYGARAIENYIRHLHRKPYLPFSSPRFIVAVLGYILLLDGFIIGGIFDLPFPLPVATITISAGLILLIASAVMSLLPHLRQARQIREGGDVDGEGRDEGRRGE